MFRWWILLYYYWHKPIVHRVYKLRGAHTCSLCGTRLDLTRDIFGKTS